MNKPILMQKIDTCHRLNEEVEGLIFIKQTLLGSIANDEEKVSLPDIF